MTAELQDKLDELVKKYDVPGVSVGLVFEGEEQYAYAGVTSVENPLPVDENTLFQFGSTGKTFTATALMRLEEQGKVDLDAPVRTYVPELRLKDEDVAERVTVLQLLNHTAGWEGDLIEEMGNGDDVLEKYVARMADLVQVTPLGAAVSYNNASLSLAGRVIEKVCGTTYEEAISDLLLKPLGMTHTFFFPNDVMSRRFAVGHRRSEEGEITVARPWAMPRANTPAGGLSANAKDQIAWARFHLGDGTVADGTQILSADNVKRMQQPTAFMKGSALGDAVGISWLLSEIDGVKIVSHGGTTNGQHSDFTMVPERNFAITSLSNCGPNGPQLNHDIVKWARQHFLGLVEAEKKTVRVPDADLAPYLGEFETIASMLEVTADDGRLSAKIKMKPEMAVALVEAGEEIPEQPPIILAMLDGATDQYMVDEGDAKGMTGYFQRAADGSVDGIHLGGRLATRVKR